MEKKLTKSNNKMIAGVCAGIAEYFNVDPTLVRVGYAVRRLYAETVIQLPTALLAILHLA